MDLRHQIIEMLMRAGSDPKIRDKVGLSPVDNAYVSKIQKDMLHEEVWPLEEVGSLVLCFCSRVTLPILNASCSVCR
jgi:hypothetical protein